MQFLSLVGFKSYFSTISSATSLLIFSLTHSLFADSAYEIKTSTPDEILSLNSDFLVEGYVSAVSGQILLNENDLHVKGAQDLFLKRTYIPPQIFGSYHDNAKVNLGYTQHTLWQLNTKGWVVMPHLNATFNYHTRCFQMRDPQGFVLEFEIQNNKGILKNSSYGCSNLRGEEPSSSHDIRNITLSVEENFVKIVWPDGFERHYSPQDHQICLEKEILPNGKIIKYEYNKEGFYKVSSLDCSEKFVYASITKTGENRYLGSDGSEANLVFNKHTIKGKTEKGNKIRSSFSVMASAYNPFYPNKVDYNKKTLLTFYDAKTYPVWCTYSEAKNEVARIQTFATPSGTTLLSYDSPIPGKKAGSTTVTHPNGSQTVYHFNRNLLLSGIENWLEGKLINEKSFVYDDKQHIKHIRTLDEEGNVLFCRSFECDIAGNPLLEIAKGDFGTFSIKRKFDQNRLVLEERDDGLQYAFTYLDQTHLMTSKTTLESGKPLRKTLYRYDSAYNLIEVEEGGRTTTYYTLYQTAPHLHRVASEEKRDVHHQLIHKICYFYDQWGNTAKQEHYGSDGQFAYAIQRTFNAKGELLKQTNPLGYTALYQYNPRGQCTYEQPISNGLTITRFFDDKGRLKILHQNDHETLFEYNNSDQLIQKTDYLGYTTKYHYHPVHGKPDLIQEPLATTQILYDALGQEIERIDPYGAKTLRTYNSYGDPLKIIHPDGGEELFDYSPNGLLTKYVDPDGLITIYSHDALGRIKQKVVGTHKTTFCFDSYHLYQMIDPAGFITEYQYDLTGRKIQEKRGHRTTCYGYDFLGFLAWEKKANRRTDYTHDVLGQLCYKSIDNLLNTSWTYDAAGNIISKKQGSLSTFNYDSHNRLIETIDPEGHQTLISYQKGPQLLIKKIIDPMQVQTVETYNPQGQLLKKEVEGQLVESFSYDKLWRLQSQDHLSFGYTLNGKKAWMKEGNKITSWTYTPEGKIFTKKKPDGTILIYEYDTQGRLIKMGDREFHYDPLNRLIGGSEFSRELDIFGNIKKEEWSNALWVESTYDDWNRPLQRNLSDQSSITYEYKGPFLKTVTRISKEGKEVYSHTYDRYNAQGHPELEISLFETQYTYDQSGRQLSQQNPYFKQSVEYNPSGNLIRKGDTTYTYDNLSQMSSESDHFTAQYDVHYNLKKLNTETITVNPFNQITTESYDLNGNLLRPGFIYDDFNQLIEAAGETYIYDALGRRIQKGTTSFIYIGDEEIASFEKGKFKELKISGSRDSIAIEIDEQPYSPITDVQGITRLLVDLETKEVAKQNDCDTFGSGLLASIPYAYSGKRYDPQTGLIYFGQRFYDPSLRRWLTPDPIGPVDHSNLYQYVFNNPFKYRDPNGEFIFYVPLLALSWKTVATAVVTAFLAYQIERQHEHANSELSRSFNSAAHQVVQSLGGVAQYAVKQLSTDKRQIDQTLPSDPDELLKDPNWKETSHSGAKENGHRTFENTETGEKLRHDTAKPGEHGHKAEAHWHRHNPNSINKFDEYLDANGTPVPRNSPESHLYPLQ